MRHTWSAMLAAPVCCYTEWGVWMLRLLSVEGLGRILKSQVSGKEASSLASTCKRHPASEEGAI